MLTGEYHKLDQLFDANSITLLFSQELLDEFIEVGRRPKFKKYFSISDLEVLIRTLSQRAEFITVTSLATACRDPKDNFLLSLAVDGKATHLITGDKDLLDLESYRETKIVTMTSYLVDK